MLHSHCRSRTDKYNVLFFYIGGYEPITELGIDKSYDEIRCHIRILLVNRSIYIKQCLHLQFEFKHHNTDSLSNAQKEKRF